VSFALVRCYNTKDVSVADESTSAIHAYLWAQEARKMSFKFKKHDCAARCPNCRVAREAVEGEGARYRDMVETPSPPGEGSSGA
jgi:hypothetical protein